MPAFRIFFCFRLNAIHTADSRQYKYFYVRVGPNHAPLAGMGGHGTHFMEYFLENFVFFFYFFAHLMNYDEGRSALTQFPWHRNQHPFRFY